MDGGRRWRTLHGLSSITPTPCASGPTIGNSSIGRLDKALDEAQAKGWTVVDMKRDWARLFPFAQEVAVSRHRIDAVRRVRAILLSSRTSGSGRIAMQSPIRNVSDTALWTAMYRAFESERVDALFIDPHARRLAGPRGAAIVRALPHGQSMAWAMVVRTAVIDEIVRACVAKGARTVVNLGCGLDTRAYRLDLPSHLRWLDIDLPGMVAYRRSLLKGEAANCDHADVAADVGEGGALAGVLALARASAGPLLVVTEGLLVYLERAQVDALARGLHDEPLARWWLTDLIAPLLLIPSAGAGSRICSRRTRRCGSHPPTARRSSPRSAGVRPSSDRSGTSRSDSIARRRCRGSGARSAPCGFRARSGACSEWRAWFCSSGVMRRLSTGRGRPRRPCLTALRIEAQLRKRSWMMPRSQTFAGSLWNRWCQN